MAQAKKAPQKKAPLSRTQLFALIVISITVGLGVGFDAGYHGSVDLGGVILGMPIGIFRTGIVWALILLAVAALVAWLLAGKRRKPRQKRQRPSLRERIHNWTSDRSEEDEPGTATAAPEESDEEEEAPAPATAPATPAPAPAPSPTPSATTVMPATPAPAAAPAASSSSSDDLSDPLVLKMILSGVPKGTDQMAYLAGFRQAHKGKGDNIPLYSDPKLEADRKAGFDAAIRIYGDEEK